MTAAAFRAYVRDLMQEEFEQIAAAEQAGDEFACLEQHDCIDPGGHLFLTSCSLTRCVHCGKVVDG